MFMAHYNIYSNERFRSNEDNSWVNNEDRLVYKFKVYNTQRGIATTNHAARKL